MQSLTNHKIIESTVKPISDTVCTKSSLCLVRLHESMYALNINGRIVEKIVIKIL